MERVKLLGYEIDTYSFDDAIRRALELADSDEVSQVITINPEMFDCADKDSDFAQILKSAKMVIPDGVGVKIALKILGYDVERIAGVDFGYELLKKAAKNDIKVALIGSKPDVIESAKQRLTEQIKGLDIVYTKDGYFHDETVVLDELVHRDARIILVALGSPKQEKFIERAKHILPYGLMVGVGGSFDVWAGTVERAPVFYQKFGLEWLYRTIKQPQRFKRIFPALPLFVLKVIREKFGV